MNRNAGKFQFVFVSEESNFLNYVYLGVCKESIPSLSKRTIDTYVSGRAVIPNAEVAVKLARALGTSVEYLVTGTECESSHIQNADDMTKFKKYKQLVREIDSLSPELRNSVAALIHAAAKVSKSS
ncbi:helix-turn-helix transcriptional regulator [Treponema sp. HNW]|uniref:hypothetical protein n=1 Tax=Treponema sp. HNW TaxID=3116654 RepID=UPI003D1245F3